MDLHYRLKHGKAHCRPIIFGILSNLVSSQLSEVSLVRGLTCPKPRVRVRVGVRVGVRVRVGVMLC